MDYKTAFWFLVIGIVLKTALWGIVREETKPRRRVTWQHEDTGYIFTKEIPAGEPTPEFPRRFVIDETPV